MNEGEVVCPEVETELECIRDHQGVESGEVEEEMDILEAEEDDHLRKLAEIIAVLPPWYVQICSTLTSPTHSDIFKLVHYEAYQVGKWEVGILLECFLVIIIKLRQNVCTF